MTQSKKLFTGAIYITFGILLPMAFHMMGVLGSVFLPMHIPVLIAGFWGGWSIGVSVGLLTPLLSSLITGMPPLMPILPIMLVELAIYGGIGGYLYNTRQASLYFSLLGAMIGGRIGAVLMAYCLTALFQIHINPLVYLSTAVIVSIPGIIIQLILIPLIVNRLQSRKF